MSFNGARPLGPTVASASSTLGRRSARGGLMSLATRCSALALLWIATLAAHLSLAAPSQPPAPFGPGLVPAMGPGFRVARTPEQRAGATHPAAATLEDRWWDGFGRPGVNDVVRAAVLYDGKVVVGGDFTWAGEALAAHIAS